MDRIDAMRVFARVMERRSFVRAAEDLGFPPSTVSDAIQQLERRLGVRLVQRTTRQAVPTLDGEAYYRRCLTILDEIEEAETIFSSAKPRGLLRVDVQGTQARRFILPGLPDFFAQYPDLELYMGEGDRLVDLVGEGIDCVLHAGEPKESDLIARKLVTLPEVTVASKIYIEQFGVPTSWDALEGHRMVAFRSSATGGVLPLEFKVKGVLKHVTLPSTLSVNGADTYTAAARQGLGLIQVPRYGVEDDIANGVLVECLPETPPSATPMYAMYPRSRQLSLRVRVFIEWVAKRYVTVGGQAE
ncbi:MULTISPECIES: LysR family transcriptional regulator [unclassified Mesorhizobium]|uniref:LysR family transcriptional regulator n=1 Tax=unclassified Mesorhizobium TaxID=325217 RepID=UPI000FD88AE4|nr:MULTISPECIES: LysR family transcriptional regulator [unclassified Mesorhizobium]TGQ16488.1 LysR family transcriptional regulator [Mesorhizobium sp. M2E.F.Ca.ET.219.01.1.1]TGT77415.1 LysR family transcriptional regulator [Mesorhizobium sp. M2E.F.Ca.ET.166.01.1.1]TGW03523.1 LysR family transcriptional regulator [Mesorhizobium sp. M2E.F.Ca.ET.154.01.1.1]